MSRFARRLEERQLDPSGWRWLYVLYDQLTDRLGPLIREDPSELDIVLVESSWKAAARPDHKARLATILANQRHFALKQAKRGVAVRHVAADSPPAAPDRRGGVGGHPARGLGSYAAGDLMTTKPYISGTNYIQRMSDSCSACRFRPGVDCPITPLYWAFLERHRGQLEENPRLRLPYATLDRRSRERREHDARICERIRELLESGKKLRPQELPDADED